MYVFNDRFIYLSIASKNFCLKSTSTNKINFSSNIPLYHPYYELIAKVPLIMNSILFLDFS